MQREAVNPWSWSQALGYHQGEVLTGVSRQLICAGQTAVDGAGAPQHPGDMRAQLALALDNLQAVLRAAGMGLGDVVSLTVYATEMAELMANLDLLGQRFGAAGVAPPTTVLGVTALAMPGLVVEIVAQAAA